MSQQDRIQDVRIFNVVGHPKIIQQGTHEGTILNILTTFRQYFYIIF